MRSLINFMYEFINRFAYSHDQEIIASMAPILGGLDWPKHLDPYLPPGLAVEKQFRDTLKSVGNFKFVVSTKIDKATAERPHFFIAYGTRSADGLKTFRQIEYSALREHARSRAYAIERKREQQLNTRDLFPDFRAELQEATIDQIVEEQARSASARLVEILSKRRQLAFSQVVEALLQPYMLRQTNVKDICLDLAKANKIRNTWGGGNRKPRDDDMIEAV